MTLFGLLVLVESDYAITAAFFIGIVGLALTAHKKKPVSGVDEMIGMQGRVQTEINPTGQILIHGELWEAESPDPINPGDSVRVTKVEGLKLHVKKVQS